RCNQLRAQQCFGANEKDRRQCAKTHTSPWKKTKRKKAQYQKQRQVNARHGAVSKFDDAGSRRIKRDDFTIAEGPMATTTRTRTTGADKRAPQNDKNVVSYTKPRKFSETSQLHLAETPYIYLLS